MASLILRQVVETDDGLVDENGTDIPWWATRVSVNPS
jgi:hypothetical protein